jgi:hypothetical protein
VILKNKDTNEYTKRGEERDDIITTTHASYSPGFHFTPDSILKLAKFSIPKTEAPVSSNQIVITQL